jgi:hypothetical protein
VDDRQINMALDACYDAVIDMASRAIVMSLSTPVKTIGDRRRNSAPMTPSGWVETTAGEWSFSAKDSG